MFRGSIPTDLQAVILETVSAWNCVDVFVGCSGNFTVERVLAPLGSFRLHSNDVTLYSWAIGRYLSGESLELSVKPQWESEWGWLAPSLETRSGCLAAIMLCTQMLAGLGRNNLYYERQRKAYRSQWAKLHAQTQSKIERLSLSLSSFHCGDVREFAESGNRTQGFACYPPFFADDYENFFAPLTEVLDWTPPQYPALDENGLSCLFQTIQEYSYWLFASNVFRPEMETYLRGRVQTTNRGVPVYIYANSDVRRVVVPAQGTETLLTPRLVQGQEIGSKIRLCPLTSGQFSTLRSQYMNHNIRPGSPLLPVAVTVDDCIIGAFAINRNRMGDPSAVYLLSDFPVAPTDYSRLAKLVLYAALSKEARLLTERSLGHRVRSLWTTAFAQNPVSMKYRGLFDLSSRKESPDPLYRYQLEYRADAGQWSLDEGLQLWKRKHGGKA